MTDDEKRVVDKIRAAFSGVVLGKGIGLREADGLDDYADAQTLADLRSQDGSEKWDSISFEDLDKYDCSLIFFDAKGMRFHLPAYLIADLAGALHTADIRRFVIGWADDLASRWQILSDAQRNAVREYLLLLQSRDNNELDRPMIDSALRGYWT